MPGINEEKLTSREWEVLGLVREGLTNEQIAGQLGISRDGVKYHVSQILSKIHASDRLEAARWYDRATATRRQPAILGFFSTLATRYAAPVGRTGGLIVVGVSVVVLVSLLIGLLLTNRSAQESTGNQSLDRAIETLLQANADDLATTFGELATTEENEWTGDRDGLRPTSTTILPATEWQQRLAGTTRTLYAVVEPLVVDGLWLPGGASGDVHLVQPADSLGAIAASQNVPQGLVSAWLAELWSLNSGPFQEGRELQLPRIEAAPRSAPAASNATVILAVDAGTTTLEAWAFRYVNGEIASLTIRTGTPESGTAALDPLINLKHLAPELSTDYDRFLVLPPPDWRPGPPVQHALSVRTGNRSVDELLAILESQDRDALLGALDTGSPLPVYDCRSITATLDAAAAQGWSAELSVTGMLSAAEVPPGHRVQADHLLMVYNHEGPYSWEPIGLFERDGRIVGIVEGDCGAGWMAQMPETYLVHPDSAADLSGLDPARRSGVPMIDAFLDAVRDEDEPAIISLVDWQSRACVEVAGPGTLPACGSGRPPGTAIDVIPFTACEGGWMEAGSIVEGLKDWALYAVPDPATAVLVAPDHLADTASFQRSARLAFNEEGLELVTEGCFVSHPNEHLMRTRFLLEPPP